MAKGGGPPSCSPPARKSAMIARVAMALPIELVVNGLPLGASTVAPAFRQRSASRMSAVTQTVPGVARSAIQSSAASKPALTTSRAINACCGTRIGLLLTTTTGAWWRKATL